MDPANETPHRDNDQREAIYLYPIRVVIILMIPEWMLDVMECIHAKAA